ncbi:MAG: ABC transporter permease [Deltaproteobacteria bacterium]|nr:ABC transporter permease [Deltaproteobacteria bacterium]
MSISAKEYGRERDMGKISLSLMSYMILAFLVLPVFIIIPLSFEAQRYLEFPPRGFSLQWYRSFFSNYEWTTATWTSFKVAFSVTLLATFLGTLAAFCFVRSDFGGKELMYGFMLSPMILPVIILAIAIYFFFAKLKLIGSILGLTIAHTVLATPYVIVIVTATLQGFDVNLEKAAMNLGANRITTFYRVTFPLIRTGVLSAALFAFLTSFDEVIIAIFICGTTANTLPKKMWDSMTMETDPTITAIATMLISLTVTVFLLIELYRRRQKAMRASR